MNPTRGSSGGRIEWSAAAASVAGSSHLKAGLPCQDACAYEIRGDVLLGAISDGAGSAVHAEEAAHAAVDVAIGVLREQSWHALPPEDECRAFAGRLFQAVFDRMVNIATGYIIPLDDFSCTLLAFAATPDGVVALQVGDGMLVVRGMDGRYELMFKPDRGEYVNETTFVTSKDARTRMQFARSTTRPRFICAGTDGIERVAIRFKDWQPHVPFFAALEQYMQARPDREQGALDVAEFLQRGKLNDKVDDDRTLLLGAAFA